jgi:hypothetical protein
MRSELAIFSVFMTMNYIFERVMEKEKEKEKSSIEISRGR